MPSPAVSNLLAMIAREHDPDVLIKYVNTCYDVEVMRAAANRIYDLGKKKEASK